MVRHPTNKCFVSKDKIQDLIDARVLTLKSEQKKVTANMVTIEFGTFPKVTVPDRHAPASKAQLEISNPSAKQHEVKGLIFNDIEDRENHMGASRSC